MSKIPIVTFCAAGFALAAGGFPGPAANAAITCRDGFQISGGQAISTPYCNDADLARIARAHGARVSADEVRRNPAKKYELCRWLGGSGDAQEYCPEEDGGSEK